MRILGCCGTGYWGTKVPSPQDRSRVNSFIGVIVEYHNASSAVNTTAWGQSV
jgi:hypothetical protein